MSSLFTQKTNFSGGELSHDLLGRVDLTSYANGALTLTNVFIEPTGGVHRRPGLKFVAELNSEGRLISYEQSGSKSYLILLQNKLMRIYKDEIEITTLQTPWTTSQIHQVRWCQGSDYLFLTHPDTCPQKLSQQEGTWTLTNFEFLKEGDIVLQPYHKYCADHITLASSGITGSVTLTASADVFTDSDVGKTFKLAAGYVVIDEIVSATSAKATVKKVLLTDTEGNPSLEPTRVWGEPTFSDEHGWPICVAFYQSRLVFGGSKKLPNNLWFSQSGDLSNFELGDGYDSEGIDFSILSDQSNVICALFAGRHLQVFTTNAEWMVTGDPLTPTSIALKRQTQVGSTEERFVPPIGIDGATIFASANGREIREFLFSDLEDAYQATDLSLLAEHLIQNPIDFAYDKHSRQAYIIMSTGDLCVLTSFRSEDLQSFTHQKTAGSFLSVAMASKKPYFVIRRGTRFFLECFEEGYFVDCAFKIQTETPQTHFSGLSILNNQTVKIVADQIVLPETTIQNGCIDIDIAASEVTVGLPYTHEVAPLPPLVGSSNGTAPVSSVRLVKGVFRVIDTESLEIDTGNGIAQVLTQPLASYQLDDMLTPRTEDIVVRALGWRRRPTDPVWRIVSSMPKKFQLVSVTSDLKIGG